MIENMRDNNEGKANETKPIKSGSGIEVITGNTNILLIAPHGVETEPYDDIGTADLTRKIANHLRCSAVINNSFRKPKGKKIITRNNGKTNIEQKVINLNIIEKAEQLDDFIKPIKDICDVQSLTYVFWIHGIKDENIKDAQCLIGYGQNKKHIKSSFTAESDIINKLIKQLKFNNIEAVLALENSSYSGFNKETMNQWFLLNSYNLNQVQSVKLNFKLTGCRDNSENLELTAEAVAKAINEVINKENMMTIEDNTQNNENEPLDEVDIVNQTNDIQSDSTVDDKPSTEVINSSHKKSDDLSDDVIVDKAYNELKKIFIDEFQRAEQSALLKSGQYLIKIFYKDDYTDAAKKQFSAKKSLNKLFERIKKETDGNTPKKTWLYNSINLAVADKKYQQYKELSDDSKKADVLSAWNEKLTVSHKIKLIHTKGLTEIQMDDLIIETANQNYKVLDLRERIGKIKEKIPKEKQSPFQKFKISLDNRFSEDALNKFDAAQLKELKKALKNIIKNIATKLDSTKEEIPIKPEEQLEETSNDNNTPDEE